jgi:hypothetical protein
VRRAGRWGRRALPILALAVSIAGCSDSKTDAALHTGNPLRYLITLDQLVAPNFTVFTAAAPVMASTLAGGDATAAAALSHDGLQSAARVEFQRIESFATANGPLDVVATVERFGSIAGASSAYSAGTRRLDSRSGATPTSTGPLGDQAHAISVVKTTPAGFPAVEITIEWRIGNLVNIIVARGRYGGTRLDDVLVLAARQTANEVGVPAR